MYVSGAVHFIHHAITTNVARPKMFHQPVELS
jgi:hypothetical protein